MATRIGRADCFGYILDGHHRLHTWVVNQPRTITISKIAGLILGFQLLVSAYCMLPLSTRVILGVGFSIIAVPLILLNYLSSSIELSHPVAPPGPTLLSPGQKEGYVEDILSSIRSAGLEENIALRAHFHLRTFLPSTAFTYCRYPHFVGHHPPVFTGMYDPFIAQSEQTLFEMLPNDSKNSLNFLNADDKKFILNRVLYITINRYQHKVQLLEEELFQCANRADILTDRLEFPSREENNWRVDERSRTVLVEYFTGSLRERFHLFSIDTQTKLLESVYCRLTQIRTGSGETIRF